MSDVETPKFGIFVNYRRADSSGHAGRLYDALIARFDPGDVFMDIDNIPPGSDFTEVIDEAALQCNVLLVVIGPNWLWSTDEDGERRLDQAEDFVRLEIETGLDRSLRVIPVLVGGAAMPKQAALPESIAAIARRQATRLSDGRWRTDVTGLLDAIDATRPAAAPAKPAVKQREATPGPIKPRPPSNERSGPPALIVASGILIAIAGVCFAYPSYRWDPAAWWNVFRNLDGDWQRRQIVEITLDGYVLGAGAVVLGYRMLRRDPSTLPIACSVTAAHGIAVLVHRPVWHPHVLSAVIASCAAGILILVQIGRGRVAAPAFDWFATRDPSTGRPVSATAAFVCALTLGTSAAFYGESHRIGHALPPLLLLGAGTLTLATSWLAKSDLRIAPFIVTAPVVAILVLSRVRMYPWPSATEFQVGLAIAVMFWLWVPRESRRYYRLVS